MAEETKIEEVKTEEVKVHEATHHEEKAHEVKPHEAKVEEHKPKVKFNFAKWLKGKNKVEYIENVSYVIIGVAALLIFLGIGLGSFVYGTIYMGSAGSLLVLLGVIIFLISQFMTVQEKKGV